MVDSRVRVWVFDGRDLRRGFWCYARIGYGGPYVLFSTLSRHCRAVGVLPGSCCLLYVGSRLGGRAITVRSLKGDEVVNVGMIFSDEVVS